METIGREAGVSKKEAEAVMAAFERVVYIRLQQNKEVTLTGFGTWSARVRHKRMGVNPQKPEERIEIPTVVVPKFKAGKALKDALKKKRAAASSPSTGQSEATPEEPSGA